MGPSGLQAWILTLCTPSPATVAQLGRNPCLKAWCAIQPSRRTLPRWRQQAHHRGLAWGPSLQPPSGRKLPLPAGEQGELSENRV